MRDISRRRLVPAAAFVGALLTGAALVATRAGFAQDGGRPPGPEVVHLSETVRVLDDAGKPVAGATVLRLRSHDTDLSGDAKYGPIVVSRATTGDDGAATSEHGNFSCVLAFLGDRAAFQCIPVPADGIQLGSAKTVRLRLVPESGEVPGDARVRLFFNGGNCRHGIDGVVQKDGVWEFPPLPERCLQPGRIDMAMAAAGWWSGPYEIARLDAKGRADVPLLRAREVQGTVVDPDGKPVSDANVWAVRQRLDHHIDGVRTRDNGKFTISDVPSSAGRAYVRARGFAPARIDVPAGGDAFDAGAVKLQRGVELLAQVVEEDGIDVVQYLVAVEDEDGARIEKAEALGRGRFRTGALAPMATRLRVYVTGSAGAAGWRSMVTELVPGKPDQVITMPTGLRIRLTGADGKPKRVNSVQVRLKAEGKDAESSEYRGSFHEIRMHVQPSLELTVGVESNDGSKGTATVKTDEKGRGDVEVRLAEGR